MKLTNLRNLAVATFVALGATGPLQAETPLEYTNEIAPGIYSFGGGNGYLF